MTTPSGYPMAMARITSLLTTLLITAVVLSACGSSPVEDSSPVDTPTPDLFTEPLTFPSNDTAEHDTTGARLRIPTLAVDMPVIPVGLEADGAMEIPDDVTTAGLYDPDGLGVKPGQPGTAVYASHVDSRRQGRGALYELSTVVTGDEISVVGYDGVETLWRVTNVTSYRKEVLPLAQIFTFQGNPRIAVITCGGEFDRTARAYTHNVVVLAEPVDS